MDKNLIAIVGMCGAGKSELTDLFVKAGFSRIHFGDLTMDELNRQGLAVNEKNEKHIREDIRARLGKSAYAQLASVKIDESENKNIVLDGLYSWSEYTFLKNKYPGIVLLAIITNNSIRKQRLSVRKIRPLTAQEVDSRDVAEIENLDKGGPIAIADYYIYKKLWGVFGMAQSRQPKKIIMWALTYDCNASCEYCYLKDFRFFHCETKQA